MTMDKGSYEAGIYRMGDVRIMDRSAEKRLPIGYDGFETVADRSLFVDKSLLVADILGGNYPITLFCRPRRFGKTLAMTMLKAFFEIPVDGIDKAPLFEGLAIWDVVALILQVFYNYILSKIEGLTSEMEDSSITLLDMITKYNLKYKK